MNDNKIFEEQMKLVEVKGLIQETEKTLRSTRYIISDPEVDCSALAELVKNLDKASAMISFIKNKAMQILDEK